jgi:hypothetical protein
MQLLPVIFLTDAVLLRVLPGLEVDNWLTALGVALALLAGTWPIGFLLGMIDITNPWILLGVAAAVNAVILMIATVLASGLRAQNAVAIPVTAVLITAVNSWFIPVAVVEVIAIWHSHRL